MCKCGGGRAVRVSLRLSEGGIVGSGGAVRRRRWLPRHGERVASKVLLSEVPGGVRRCWIWHGMACLAVARVSASVVFFFSWKASVGGWRSLGSALKWTRDIEDE